MIKLFVFSFLIVVVISSPVVNTDEDKHVPGFCKVGDHYIRKGEQGPGPLGECSRVTCEFSEDGREMTSGVSCGTFLPRQGCWESELDLTKLYPDCCPVEVCDPDFKSEVHLIKD